MGAITTVFFDIGGVCLTNGWDHEQRQLVARQLGFDYEAFDSRHRQVADTLERGEMTLADYLSWTLFYEPRPFTRDEAVTAIKQLSAPFDETLALVAAVRRRGRQQLFTLNNESRELNEHRIARFGLRAHFAAFFSSCYLHLLKPQPEFYERAMRMVQCAPDECLFVDDRPMNVEVARILGMHTVQFTTAADLELALRDHGAL